MAESEIPKAQWPVILHKKCELCGINPITFKCLNCDEMVCDNCKTAHLGSKMTKGHKVVCLKFAELSESNQTGIKCPSHTNEDLLMFCNTCNCPICRECVTNGLHLNHPMVKLEEVLDIKEKQLSNIIEQAKENLKKYKDVIASITQIKLQFSKSIVKKIDMVKSRNRELKIMLDKIESDYIRELKNTEKAHEKAMTELEQKFKGEILDLSGLIQQCDQKMGNKSADLVHFVTDITQRLKKYRSCDPPKRAFTPELTTRHVDEQELKDMFGRLNKKKKRKKEVNPPIPPDRNISSDSPAIDVNPPLPPKRNISSASPAFDVNPPLPPRKIISSAIPAKDVNPPLPPKRDFPSSSSPVKDVKIVSSFSSKKSHVIATSYNQAWLWSWSNKAISLVTSDGKVIQDINTDFGVYDVAISNSGDLLATVLDGNKVKMLTRNNTFKDIYTADGYKTLGITGTDTGNVLVGLYSLIKGSKIVEITTSGQHIRTIQHDIVDKKLLFNNPRSICTNINGDVIVVSVYKVVAINKSGKKRFIYDGTERKLSNSFSPQTAVTDRNGQIIISDINNSALHVLDGDGKLIQYLTKPTHGCHRPMGIAVDSSGILWVCYTENDKIFQIQYV